MKRLPGVRLFLLALVLAEYAVPGAAIALVQDGGLTLMEGFGVRDLATGAPTTADTVFQLASVSKTFTAATVAALVDRQRLTWEQPMVALLPDFRLHDAYAGRWRPTPAPTSTTCGAPGTA